MTKVACFILSYEITRGMKSVGPKALLKSKKSKELINCQILGLENKKLDLKLILGFGYDKIKKKVENDKIDIIKNDLFEETNHGYAFELILDHYNDKKYAGCMIINNGILLNKSIISQILDSNLKESKIFYINTKKDTNFNIGFTINNDKVEHMFFNLGNNLWGEVLYIDNESIKKHRQLYTSSMRNMFLFELINKSIDNGMIYKPIKLRNSDIVKISTTKDSYKIKEKI